jgi:hypothetical protein
MISCLMTFIICSVSFAGIFYILFKFGLDSIEKKCGDYAGIFLIFLEVGLSLTTIITGLGLCFEFHPWLEANRHQYEEVIVLVQEYPEHIWMLEDAKSDGKLSCWEYHRITDKINYIENQNLKKKRRLENRAVFVNLTLEAEQ